NTSTRDILLSYGSQDFKCYGAQPLSRQADSGRVGNCVNNKIARFGDSVFIDLFQIATANHFPQHFGATLSLNVAAIFRMANKLSMAPVGTTPPLKSFPITSASHFLIHPLVFWYIDTSIRHV
ncbi:hypothetical protein HPP92_029039, partial [Vanilla planifolia]